MPSLDTPGKLYLLHFNQPYKHARHYLGWTEGNVVDRLNTHEAGHGARLIEVIRANGIGFECVKVWEGTKRDERRLKRWHGMSRLCPVCRRRGMLKEEDCDA